jgi:CheY-like chemotaxis protein/anti-sigma regulatory factor (Ser/Thr protein kinase)
MDGAQGDVLGDLDRLQQVFGNLLNNAAKFTPAGGTITVRATAANGQFKVAVADTGHGIDPAFLPHVFERFRQADSSLSRSHSGLGIGLTIVRHLVQLHHGTVTAESDGPNRGATFTVTLPVTTAVNTAPAPSPGPAPGATPSSIEGLHVLLVDDDADTRELVGEILRRHQATVDIAASARQAMQLVASAKPDVMVSDIAMPEQDGYSLVRELRRLPAEHGGKLPAIALTAFAGEDDRRRSIEAGFQLHLLKPVNAVDLISAVSHFGREKRQFARDVQATRDPAIAAAY